MLKLNGLLVAALALAGTGMSPAIAQTKPSPPPSMPATPELGAGPWDYQTQTGKLHVEAVARGLDHPWAIAFLPNGDMLVTERVGRLRLIHDGKLVDAPVAGLPEMSTVGLAGLMDLALHPQFARNHLVYFSYAKAWPGRPKLTTIALARARWDGHALVGAKDVYVAPAWYGEDPIPQRCCGQGPAIGSYGGRIAFDDKGYVYLSSGDRNFGEMAQHPDTGLGKIFRLNADGSVPRDNPFVGRKGYIPAIWSLGHRNPSGLYFDPVTKVMWETEFGPRGDELNRIVRGGNFGWIDVTQALHYDGTPAKGIRNVPGIIDAVIALGPPSINPGNLTLQRGKLFPGWQGDLLMAAMTRQLVRIHLDAKGEPTGEQEALLKDLGQRLREARTAPDGSVYVLTDEQNGAVLRLTPG